MVTALALPTYLFPLAVLREISIRLIGTRVALWLAVRNQSGVD